MTSITGTVGATWS